MWPSILGSLGSCTVPMVTSSGRLSSDMPERPMVAEAERELPRRRGPEGVVVEEEEEEVVVVMLMPPADGAGGWSNVGGLDVSKGNPCSWKP